MSDFRWYRRLIGGHWERWWMDVIHADVWYHRPHDGTRPHVLARGTPTCEDWS